MNPCMPIAAACARITDCLAGVAVHKDGVGLSRTDLGLDCACDFKRLLWRLAAGPSLFSFPPSPNRFPLSLVPLASALEQSIRKQSAGVCAQLRAATGNPASRSLSTPPPVRPRPFISWSRATLPLRLRTIYRYHPAPTRQRPFACTLVFPASVASPCNLASKTLGKYRGRGRAAQKQRRPGSTTERNGRLVEDSQ